MNLRCSRRFWMGVLHSRWRGEGKCIGVWRRWKTFIRVAFKIIATHVQDHCAQHQTQSFYLSTPLASVGALGAPRPLHQCFQCVSAHVSLKYFALSNYFPIFLCFSRLVFAIRSTLCWHYYEFHRLCCQMVVSSLLFVIRSMFSMSIL